MCGGERVSKNEYLREGFIQSDQSVQPDQPDHPEVELVDLDELVEQPYL